MFWPIVSLWYFGGSFVWVAFLLAGEWLMSLEFQRVAWEGGLFVIFRLFKSISFFC